MTEAKARVLVVQGEPKEREAVASLLREGGYDVEAVESGHDAAEALERRRPHLVVLDVDLPEGTAGEVRDRLQATPPTPPVLLLSRRGDNPRQDAFKPYVAACLFKPVEGAQLLGTCRRILALSARAEDFAAERRREMRRRIVLEVTLLGPDDTALARGTLWDLSPAGFQLEVPVPLDAGGPVRIGLHLPGRTVKLEGHVRWCRPVPASFTSGVQVSWVDPVDASLLREICEAAGF
jgi:CheY-like chemotaxis protein